MSSKDLVKVFTDTEMTVIHLKNILTESGIESLVKNDYNSGVAAGFVAGTISSVDLFVSVNDADKALTIVKEFVENFQK